MNIISQCTMDCDFFFDIWWYWTKEEAMIQQDKIIPSDMIYINMNILGENTKKLIHFRWQKTDQWTGFLWI